ncbi:MAG: PAS domain-containing sensor histidine kinase, partial [Pyrinomonadaceae bacterium]
TGLSITGGWLVDASILPMVLIPLTFGNSVLRYRLMDVDMMVRRTAVYALTSITIAALIGIVVYVAGIYALGSGDNSSSTYEANVLRVLLAVAAMTAVVMAAAPIKNFLQERTDRLFYGERYDLRNSLLDFGRTLSGTTTIDRLIESLIDRLQQVLDVERIAIFIQDPSTPSGYRVAGIRGLSMDLIVPPDFREMIRVRSAATGVVRADGIDISTDIDGFVRRPIHYYVPCVTRDQMVAIIGLGRSADGSLLSSEDLEVLLHTVSGYIAVAIENSLLYEEQQKHAAQMETLKEFNESIVESINVGLLAADLDGRIASCNSALEVMLGISREEALGRHFEDLFAKGFAVSIRNTLGSDYLHETALKHVYKLRTSSTQNRPLIVNIALTPLRDDSGNRTGSLIVVEDVTARVQFEEQLQQREKLSSIGLLAAGVAHEINTPLTGVSSYTQMLLGMLSESDPKHRLLEKINHQADRASDIVGNLLNFSRAGSTSQFGVVNINRILDDTLQLLEPQLRRGRVEVVREYTEGLPAAAGSAGKLQQVFTNLILNARDSMDDGGCITLKTCRGEHNTVLVSVSDTGVGIAPENITKIYDPFFTTKEVGRGTGLGLAVSYGIIQEHSGNIRVESQPGKGTMFTVTLPVEVAESEVENRLHARGGA